MCMGFMNNDVIQVRNGMYKILVNNTTIAIAYIPVDITDIKPVVVNTLYCLSLMFLLARTSYNNNDKCTVAIHIIMC